MRCSECTRRNHDDNQFCIYCGTALEPKTEKSAPRKNSQPKKVMLPPQDIDTLIANRHLAASVSPDHVHPAVILSLAAVIGAVGLYYWFVYRDVYQVMAIDYQNSDLMNE